MNNKLKRKRKIKLGNAIYIYVYTLIVQIIGATNYRTIL